MLEVEVGILSTFKFYLTLTLTLVGILSTFKFYLTLTLTLTLVGILSTFKIYSLDASHTANTSHVIYLSCYRCRTSLECVCVTYPDLLIQQTSRTQSLPMHSRGAPGYYR